MVTIVLYLSSLISPVSGAACEELGPRLDGRYVTVCNGEVVRVRDGLGNSRTWNRGGAIVARSSGSEPMVLEPAVRE
jgi:hypothetical protein